MSYVYFPNYKRASAAMKSIASGDLSDPSNLAIQNVDGTWDTEQPYTPEAAGLGSKSEGNSLYIEAGHTLTLTQDHSCKDLHLNGTQDVVRLNTGAFKLDVWGKLRTYTGTAPGTSDGTSAGAGIAGFLAGTLRFKGNANRDIVVSNELTANARIAGWTLEFDFDSGVTGTINKTIRCGYLVVTSGILSVVAGEEIRPAGDDYTAQPGNGVSGGTVTIKSGATLKCASVHKNNVTNAGNCVASFTLESGATFIPTISAGMKVSTLAYNLSGTVKFELAGAQEFLSTGGKVGAVDITTYGTVHLANSGAKSLMVNTTVNTLLIIEGTASLNLGAFTLSYGTNADLQYNTSITTTDSEFPNSTTLTSIPRNLIIPDGVTVTLNSNKNIRGTVQKPGSGTGVLNLNGFTLTENYA